MPETSDHSKYKAAEYRVRLFLSVDLSGSTAFKNSAQGEEVAEGSAPRWVTEFQQFYTDFPDLYAKEYHQLKSESAGDDGCPKLWKAIGDELVFCGRVRSVASVELALRAFIRTLLVYRKKLSAKKLGLDVKGSAWLAAFPEPNRAIKLRKDSDELMSASEALEAAADASPFDYDFLGKAIDTGFRVASNATPERFVISVQLAQLLCKTEIALGNGFQIRIDKPATLRGVNKDEPYPVLFFDCLEHLPSKNLRAAERKVLRDRNAPDRDDLAEYLEKYCSVVGTDQILIKNSSSDEDVDPPATYTSHRSRIEHHLQSEKGRELANENGDALEDSSNSDDTSELPGNALHPLNKGS